MEGGVVEVRILVVAEDQCGSQFQSFYFSLGINVSSLKKEVQDIPIRNEVTSDGSGQNWRETVIIQSIEIGSFL